MASELLLLSRGSFRREEVMNMEWREFSFWHKKIVDAALKFREV